MSNDNRICAENRVAARVVAMPVRIEQKSWFVRAEFLERGFDFIGKSLKWVVNHQKPVLADRNADVSALPEKNINVATDFFGFNDHVLLIVCMISFD